MPFSLRLYGVPEKTARGKYGGRSETVPQVSVQPFPSPTQCPGDGGAVHPQLSGDLGEVEPSILLRGISRLNQALPFGAVLLVEPRPELGLPLMAAVRAVQGFPLDQPLDQGTFTEDLFLLETSCQIADFVLGALRTGKTVDEAFAQLTQ